MSDSDSSSEEEVRTHLKVVAFNGSPHQDGNTTKAVKVVFEELAKAGIETRMVFVSTTAPIRNCIGCDGCRRIFHCMQAPPTDPVHTWRREIEDCDGIILASPTHFANVSAGMKSFIDRVGYMVQGNKELKNKVGASITACEASGGTSALAAMNKFFGITEVHIIGSCNWNISIESSSEDEKAGTIKGLQQLGQNMAYVLKKLHPTATLFDPALQSALPVALPTHTPEHKTDPGLAELEKPLDPARPLKVVAFNGSNKLSGNTVQLINMVFEELRAEGIECELVHIGNAKNFHTCLGCYSCAKTGKCIMGGVDDDPVNLWLAKAKQADGILLGSPTHYANVSTAMKSFIDRVGVISSSHNFLQHKVGAAVVAVRRGGAASVYDHINSFFTYLNMHVVSTSYWNLGIGRKPGEVQADEEGKTTMHNLGKNMAYMLKALHPERTTGKPETTASYSGSPSTDVEDVA